MQSSKSDITADTLYRLLGTALIVDSLKYENEMPFLFFKSGFILNQSEKNSVMVSCPTDSTYQIKLYTQQDHTWILNCSIDSLSAFPSQFDAIFEDYNFDNQKDIYIQVSASNGYSLSRGHLIIVDPSTKKLTEHKEARGLANMRPDPITKTVTSEIWLGWNSRNQQHLLVQTNKWVNNQLRMVKKKIITLD